MARKRRDDDFEEEEDERPKRRRRPPELGDDAGVRMLLPVGRSGWAIAAGYLGLFAVLCIPAPLALIAGIIAVIDIKKNPKKHGMGRAIFGIVMGGIFTVLLLISMVVAAAGKMK